MTRDKNSGQKNRRFHLNLVFAQGARSTVVGLRFGKAADGRIEVRQRADGKLAA